MAKTFPYETQSVEEVLSTFEVDSQKGLNNEQVRLRVEKYGKNILKEEKESLIKKLFSFFWGPIPWMIEIAAILSGVLGRWPDFILIVALLFINAALGFFHEYKADNAIAALKERLALKAKVLREGIWAQINAGDLVPGDIISVKLGNVVPADIKLVSGNYLLVDQSALTGESLPSEKKGGNIAFSGTLVKKGEMTGVVTSIGMETFFGKTAKLVQTAKTVSHFQKAVMNIGKFLISATLSIVFILLVFSLFRLEFTTTYHESLGSIAIFLLVLVVAGIPVALPAVMSVTMAIGADKMAKRKAILSKLMAIEELAGMNILCSDKTGTLTKNELTVGDIVTFGNVTEDQVLETACLASKEDKDDAIDAAIIQRFNQELKGFSIKEFLPFDPVSKKSEAKVQKDSEVFSVCKGAPQVILDLSKPTFQKEVEQKIQELAVKGFRTLGVAKTINGKWEFLGLIPLFDPPREDTAETIDYAREMGVKIKMVTGDNQSIAKEMAEKLDLGTNIISISEIPDTEKKEEMYEKADGFAEVFPEHKYQIVQTLQKKGNIVGMTGDGVNDAPALKQADIGIAVSNATDAARAASDLVLTEPGLSVIKTAIEEARKIFGRMRSYAIYRISETCRLLLFLLLAMIVFQSHPLSAIMIILIALLNDIPIMTIAYDHMRASKKPDCWDLKEIFWVAVGLSIVGVISTFGLYWIGERLWLLSKARCSTLAFFAILCGGNLTIYFTRNQGLVFDRPLPEYKFFLATLFSQSVGTIVSAIGVGTSDLVGIGWKYIGYSWIYIVLWFVLTMFVKKGIYQFLAHTKKEKRYFDKITEVLHHHKAHIS